MIFCIWLLLSIMVVIIALVTTIGILYLTGVVYHGCDCCHGDYNWYFIFDCSCVSWLWLLPWWQQLVFYVWLVLSIRFVIVVLVILNDISYFIGICYADCDCCHGNFHCYIIVILLFSLVYLQNLVFMHSTYRKPKPDHCKL